MKEIVAGMAAQKDFIHQFTKTMKAHPNKLLPPQTMKVHPSKLLPQQMFLTTQASIRLLQVQRVETKKGTANVMWDNAASLCFITNAKAKQEKHKGVKVNLSIVKIGGQNGKIETMKYKLPLLDKQGHAVEFEVYGINKTISDIEHVNIESIAHLFRNVTKDEIAQPAGPVDVLIKYEYAAYHPEREQNIGHLVLLKNRFGRCVGGTQPLLKEVYMTHNLGNAKVNTICRQSQHQRFLHYRGPWCTVQTEVRGDTSVENAPWAPKIIPYRKKGKWN